MAYFGEALGVSPLRSPERGAMMDVQPPRPSHLADESRYRAFLLDADGKVISTAHLPAETDDAALALALAMVDGHAVEVWDGLRFIEHFDALTPTDSQSLFDYVWQS